MAYLLVALVLVVALPGVRDSNPAMATLYDRGGGGDGRALL